MHGKGLAVKVNPWMNKYVKIAVAPVTRRSPDTTVAPTWQMFTMFTAYLHANSSYATGGATATSDTDQLILNRFHAENHEKRRNSISLFIQNYHHVRFCDLVNQGEV